MESLKLLFFIYYPYNAKNPQMLAFAGFDIQYIWR